MKNDNLFPNSESPWSNFDARTVVIIGLTIAVVIWTLLFFIDKPNPKRQEEAPINIALNQTVDQGVLKPFFGADVEDITPDLISRFKIVAERGVYVRKVMGDSPAELADLRRADVINSVDGIKIDSTSELANFLQSKKIGDRIKVRILRNNKKQSLSVTLTAKNTTNKKSLLMAAAPLDGDAWLGLDVQSLDNVMVRQLRLPNSKGVVISHVVVGSPAAESGLVRGDVVRTIDKMPVNDRMGFTEIMTNKNPGDIVKLEIFRNGFEQDVQVTAGVMPADVAPSLQALPGPDIEVEVSWLGLTVVPIDPLEAKELGLPAGTKGLAVDGLSIGPAFDAGFQVGDILMAVNGMPTTTLRQFKDATDGARGAMVDVWRGGRHRYVTIAAPGLDRQGNQLPNSAAASQIARILPVDNGMRYIAIGAMGDKVNAQISPAFPKSPYFIIVDLKTGKFNPVLNPNAEATGIVAAKWLTQNHIDAVIIGRMGPRAFDELNSVKIPVYAGVLGTVSEVVQAFRQGQLKPSVTVLGSTQMRK